MQACKLVILPYSRAVLKYALLSIFQKRVWNIFFIVLSATLSLAQQYDLRPLIPLSFFLSQNFANYWKAIPYFSQYFLVLAWHLSNIMRCAVLAMQQAKFLLQSFSLGDGFGRGRRGQGLSYSSIFKWGVRNYSLVPYESYKYIIYAYLRDPILSSSKFFYKLIADSSKLFYKLRYWSILIVRKLTSETMVGWDGGDYSLIVSFNFKSYCELTQLRYEQAQL